MLARLIILAAMLIALFWVLRWLARAPPRQVARRLRQVLVWGAIGLLVLAAATGRLNPLFALVAAAIPAMARIIALVRLLPAVQQLLQTLGLAAPSLGAAAGPGASGQASSIRTRFLEMRLDHASGRMDGLILKGRFQGRRLSELQLADLLDLLGDCRRADRQSAALLETYLDREHGEDWQEQADGSSNWGDGAGSGALSRQEALDILGLAPSASPDEIRAAHRRLMQKYHPDRGGSDYLAAKINAAKRLLLGD